MLMLIGLTGALLSITSHIPYIIDTLKSETQPHRVTWGMLFLLNLVFFANNLAAGAESSIWLIVASLLSTFTVFILSFKYGVGGGSKLDIVAIVVIFLGVALWLILDSPLASILTNLLVALAGAVPTIKKAYLHPETETKSKWLMGSVGGLLAAISVGELNLTLLLFPLSVFLFQGILYILLVRQRLFPANKT